MPSERPSVDVCVWGDYQSVEAFLKEGLKLSGQAIKRHDFPLAWLRGPLTHQTALRLPLSLLNQGMIWPSYQGPVPKLLAEDESFVAIHKPPGVHTHPLGYVPDANLLSWLVVEGRHDLLRVNLTGIDRGCLYRLDEPTSGLVLYAKEDRVYREVRENFAERVLHKHYLAIVEGTPSETGVWEDRLVPTGVKGHKMRVARDDVPGGAHARLSYQSLASSGELSLVLVKLETGVRHQIRAQFASRGHPLLGDTFYGGKQAERLFLHCWRYGVEWDGQHRFWVDEKAELFGGFFDLDRLLEMVLKKLG